MLACILPCPPLARGGEPIAALYVTEARAGSVAAYYIRDGGVLDRKSFQRISVDRNPRRLIATTRALYVATVNRVEAFRVDPVTGRLARFVSAKGKHVRPALIVGANFQSIAVDPEERHLYASARKPDQIFGYPIATDGSIEDPDSCVQGETRTSYVGLVATQTLLYAAAAGSGRVEIFSLGNEGEIESFAVKASCQKGADRGNACTDDSQCADKLATCNDDSLCAKGPDKGDPCMDDADCTDVQGSCSTQVCANGLDEGNNCLEDDNCRDDPSCPDGVCACGTVRQPQVFATCKPGTFSFPAASTGILGRPKGILLNTRDDILYITELIQRRIYACPLAEDGSLPGCRPVLDDTNPQISRTKSGSKYEQLALSARDVLFASVFLSGKLRAFVLDADGSVPRKAQRRRPSNLFSAPAGITVCGNMLYVAEGDLDRINAFEIGETGFERKKPSSRTAIVKDSFPNSLAILPLGSSTCTS